MPLPESQCSRFPVLAQVLPSQVGIDTDREGPDTRLRTAPRHRELLSVDAALQGPVHRLQEVVAVLLGVETE